MLKQVASGAAVGAAVGAFAGWAIGAMKSRRASAEEVGAYAEHLGKDLQVAELVSRFKTISDHSDETRQLYATLVTSADEMVRLCQTARGEARGVASIRANRLAFASCASARKLCKIAFDEHKDENAPLLAAEVDNLEGHLNNYLHNLML